jgi:hypothetical protein
MARLNNDAREILCKMVTEKAEAKRKQLNEKLTDIDNERSESYEERVKAARKDIELMIPTIKIGIDRILQKHKLGWEKRNSCYSDSNHTFEDIFDDGELRKDLMKYFSNLESEPNRLKLVKQQLEQLDAAVAKAKQEILLRAALGMKYDEVVAIVNGFQF